MSRSFNRRYTSPPDRAEIWISAAEFAATQQISVQAARTALRGARQGKTWRGRQLEIRVSPGRGGRSGLCYEVKSEAASPGDHLTETKCTARTTTIDAKAATRFEAVREVFDHAAHCRGAAVKRAALVAGVSPRTLYRWVGRYEADGLRGLARTKPASAGRPRVLISRAFDRAADEAGWPESIVTEIARDLQRSLKGLWASRAEQAGAAEIRRLAQAVLFELCEARGLSLPEHALRLSRRYVERFSAYRVVNQRRNDRKAFDDAKPRIRRDWTALLPMERVVADVKHLDVVVRREDGSAAWPKIIAFMDAGTGRVLAHPVLLERGEGVRQEHVIEAFLAMTSHPEWGFPQGLYLDNGAEFGALAKLDGALQLLNETGARTLIFARPYNASAKPIESLFARLDRQVFSLLPGYVGPDRMAKKTQTLGKPPLPYPGDWEDFRATLHGLLHAHNHRAVGGGRSNRSPEDWYRTKVDEGWRPVRVDPSALDAAFSDPDSRRVDRGVVKINGRRYSHERLASLPSRTIVDLALPWRRNARPLAKLAGAWVYLDHEPVYPARWIEGARESSRRQKSQDAYVSALAKEAPIVDPVALKIRWGDRQGAAPMMSAHRSLDLGHRPREQAKAIQSARREPTAPSSADIRRAREMALTERLERRQRGDD